jgi:uncharacterized membrane protein
MEAPTRNHRLALSTRLAQPLIVATAILLLSGFLLNTPAGLLGKADAIGYAVCHRIDLRSFHLGERQLPLCARCSGMYLGALLGLIYQSFTAPRFSGMPPRRLLFVLGGLLLAFAIDGTNSLLSLMPGAPLLYPPHNTFRLITGTGMGLTIAALLYPAFNETVWQDREERPALSNFRSLGILLMLGILLDGLVISGNPLILYLLALSSAGGVLALLTLIYTMVWLMLLHAENRFCRPVELLPSLTAGFVLALLQIALFDLIRHLLTGSWDGFRLGKVPQNVTTL